MARNGYLERRQEEIDAWMIAQKHTTIQYMVDTFMVVLHDPDIMGKDTFGKERIKKVVKAWMETYNIFHEAMEKTPEADYWQEKLDGKLRDILGDELVPFAERYEWLKKTQYGGKKKR